MTESQNINYEEKLKNLSELPDLTVFLTTGKESSEKNKQNLNKKINDSMILISGITSEIENLTKNTQGEINKINQAISEASQKQEPILNEMKTMLTEMLNLDSFDKSLSEINKKMNEVKATINNESDASSTPEPAPTPAPTSEPAPIASSTPEPTSEPASIASSTPEPTSETSSDQGTTTNESVSDSDNNDDPFTNTGGESTMEKRNELMSNIKNEWKGYKGDEKDITKWSGKTNQLAQKLKNFDEENKNNNGKYGPTDQTPDLKKYINELGGLKGGKKRKGKSKKTNKRKKSMKKIKKTKKRYSKKSKK